MITMVLIILRCFLQQLLDEYKKSFLFLHILSMLLVCFGIVCDFYVLKILIKLAG